VLLLLVVRVPSRICVVAGREGSAAKEAVADSAGCQPRQGGCQFQQIGNPARIRRLSAGNRSRAFKADGSMSSVRSVSGRSVSRMHLPGISENVMGSGEVPFT
jgi:hypothetical protein